MTNLWLVIFQITLKPLERTKHGVDTRVIAAYAEATNKPVLVVHPKDNVVRNFNASSHNEAVCLVFENQHYELLLSQDCDLQAIWQRAEDGGHTGHSGAAKSSGSKSLRITDFASIRVTDFASSDVDMPTP